MRCDISTQLKDKLIKNKISLSLVKSLTKEEISELFYFFFEKNIIFNIKDDVNCKKNNDYYNKQASKVLDMILQTGVISQQDLFDIQYTKNKNFIATLILSNGRDIKKINGFFITYDHLKAFEELFDTDFFETYNSFNKVFDTLLSFYIGNQINSYNFDKLKKIFNVIIDTNTFRSSPFKFFLSFEDEDFFKFGIELMFENNTIDLLIKDFVSELLYTDMSDIVFVINTLNQLDKKLLNKFISKAMPLVFNTTNRIKSKYFINFNEIIIFVADKLNDNIIKEYLDKLSTLTYDPDDFDIYYGNISRLLDMLNKKHQEYFFNKVLSVKNTDALPVILLIKRLRLNDHLIRIVMYDIYDTNCNLIKKHKSIIKIDLSDICSGHHCEAELGYTIFDLLDI